MKICFVVPTIGNSGGMPIIMNIANVLSESGYKVDVVYPIITPNINGWRFTKPYDFIKMIGWIPLNLISFNKKKYLNKYKSVNLKRVFTLNHIPINYDEYIATWWETAVFVNKLEVKKKKYLIQAYEIWNGNSKEVFKTYNYDGFELITICRYLELKISRHTNKTIKLLYNNIDLTKFKRNENLKDIMSVGLIYRPNKWKKIENFISYLDMYRRNDMHYYCIGRKIPPKYIDKFDKVFDGNVQSEMELFYNKIGILVVPSDDMEGFGLPIIEAMSCGTPIAVMSIGIAYEIIKDGVNSLIMESNDAASIKTAIDRYANLRDQEKKNMQIEACNTINIEYRNKIEKNKDIILDYFT